MAIGSFSGNPVSEWLRQYKPQLVELVNLSQSELFTRKSTILDSFFPRRPIDDMSLLWMALSYTPTIGYVIATDGEIPASKDNNLDLIRENQAELAKIGKSYVITENDLVRAGELVKRSRMQEGMGLMDAISRILIPRTADLVPQIMETMDAMTWTMLVDGAIDFRSEKTNQTVVYDYLTPEDRASNNDGLIRDATALIAPWSNAGAADGLSDIITHLNAYYAKNFRFPDKIVMHRKNLMELLNQASVRRTISATLGNFLGTEQVDNVIHVRQQFESVMQRATASGIELEIFDELYAQEFEDGSCVSVPFLPEETYIFLARSPKTIPTGLSDSEIIDPLFNRGMGIRAVGPHPSNNMRPGPFLSEHFKNPDPFRHKIAASVYGIPAIFDGRLIGSQKLV